MDYVAPSGYLDLAYAPHGKSCAYLIELEAEPLPVAKGLAPHFNYAV
jgi:hypothetical protein